MRRLLLIALLVLSVFLGVVIFAASAPSTAQSGSQYNETYTVEEINGGINLYNSSGEWVQEPELERGGTYLFIVGEKYDDANNGPFHITTSSVGGEPEFTSKKVWTDGIDVSGWWNESTAIGRHATENGTLVFHVQNDTPDTLYYQSFDEYSGDRIHIVDNTTNTTDDDGTTDSDTIGGFTSYNKTEILPFSQMDVTTDVYDDWITAVYVEKSEVGTVNITITEKTGEIELDITNTDDDETTFWIRKDALNAAVNASSFKPGPVTMYVDGNASFGWDTWKTENGKEWVVFNVDDFSTRHVEFKQSGGISSSIPDVSVTIAGQTFSLQNITLEGIAIGAVVAIVVLLLARGLFGGGGSSGGGRSRSRRSGPEYIK